jgi:uncharacterized membrane protein YdbT with pleckstrin-like domain
MSYIEDSLVEGESVLYRAKMSWKAVIWPLVLLGFMIWLFSRISALMGAIAVIMSIYALVQIYLIIATTEFALTNQRIIAKKGIIRRHSLEILLNKVESISISQRLDGRFFGFGTVTVVGSGGTEERFGSIGNPMELRKRVNSQIAKVKP